MVYEPQNPTVLIQRRSTQSQQHLLNNGGPRPNPAIIGPAAMQMMRKPPAVIGEFISPTLSRKNLMRQVSGLGMEDPVFRTSKDDGSPEHPSNIFDDMSFSDVPEDMRDLVSIVSDPTAIRGLGLDIECYEQVLMMKPYEDPNPEFEKLGQLADDVSPDAQQQQQQQQQHYYDGEEVDEHQQNQQSNMCNVQVDPNFAPPPPRHPGSPSSKAIRRVPSIHSSNANLQSHQSTEQARYQTQPQQQQQQQQHPPNQQQQQQQQQSPPNLHESACTLQSLDLEAVFGQDRVRGVPNLATHEPNNHTSTHSNTNYQQQQQLSRPHYPQSSSYRHSGNRIPLPMSSQQRHQGSLHHHQQQQQHQHQQQPNMEEAGGDPLLYEAAIAMQQQGSNIGLVQKALNVSHGLDRASMHSRNMLPASTYHSRGNSVGSVHSRTSLSRSHHNPPVGFRGGVIGAATGGLQQQQLPLASYSDHAHTKSSSMSNNTRSRPSHQSQQHQQSKNSTLPLSHHGTPVGKNPHYSVGTGSYRVQNKNTSNLDGIPNGSATNRNYRPPPSTHSRKKKEGPRRRSLPTMSNIFPWEEQQEQQEQEQPEVTVPQQQGVSTRAVKKHVGSAPSHGEFAGTRMNDMHNISNIMEETSSHLHESSPDVVVATPVSTRKNSMMGSSSFIQPSPSSTVECTSQAASATTNGTASSSGTSPSASPLHRSKTITSAAANVNSGSGISRSTITNSHGASQKKLLHESMSSVANSSMSSFRNASNKNGIVVSSTNTSTTTTASSTTKKVGSNGGAISVDTGVGNGVSHRSGMGGFLAGAFRRSNHGRGVTISTSSTPTSTSNPR
jgi:hypothetical protein